MTAEELSAFLDEAQAENPLIELTRNREPYEQELSVGRWLGNLAPERPEYSANDDDLTVPDIPCADTERLEDHLRMQIQFSRLPAQLCTAVQYLIGNLDENGRLPLQAQQIAAACHCSPACAEQAIRLVQSLEPAGVAARDLAECLLLQLQARPTRSAVAERIVSTCLDAIATMSPAGIAGKCGPYHRTGRTGHCPDSYTGPPSLCGVSVCRGPLCRTGYQRAAGRRLWLEALAQRPLDRNH